MKFLQKLVIGSLIAIALIETRRHVATAQAHSVLQVARARPLLLRESRLYRIRRKIALRLERSGLKRAKSSPRYLAVPRP